VCSNGDVVDLTSEVPQRGEQVILMSDDDQVCVFYDVIFLFFYDVIFLCFL